MSQTCKTHYLIGAVLATALVTGCNWASKTTNANNTSPDVATEPDTPDGGDPVSMRPQIVRLERIELESGTKIIYMGNRLGTYALACDEGQGQGISPSPVMSYFLFGPESRWRFPNAQEYTTLKGFQDWVGQYPKRDNAVLVAVVRDKSGHWERSSDGQWGIYWLKSWQARQPN